MSPSRAKLIPWAPSTLRWPLCCGRTLATGRTAITRVAALGFSFGLSATAPLTAGAEPAALLATQFAELVRLQPGKPVLLTLDEAQPSSSAAQGTWPCEGDPDPVQRPSWFDTAGFHRLFQIAADVAGG